MATKQLFPLVDPSHCATRGYIIGGLRLLGCFTANNTATTIVNGNNTNLIPERGCIPDQDLAGALSPKNTINNPSSSEQPWHTCDAASELVYTAYDPANKQTTVNCDHYTNLPNNAGVVHGCYMMLSNVLGSANSSTNVFQCMSNNVLRTCTMNYTKIMAMKQFVLPSDKDNAGSQDANQQNLDRFSTTNHAAEQKKDNLYHPEGQKVSTIAWTGMIGGIVVGSVGIIGIATLLLRRRILQRRAQQERLDRFTSFGTPI
jgi:hypothetical protein